MIPNVLEDRRTLWVLVALMSILFTVTNLPWELDGYDQAKQAWTSYEMVTEGHWFYQRTSDDQGLATKPPLTGWTSAAVFLVTRSWDIAWRLPPFLCAAAIAILLFRSASRAYGTLAGLIAFAAFGFNLLTPRLATLVRSDMPLTLVVFVIGLLIWEKIRSGAPWSSKDRQIIFALLTAGLFRLRLRTWGHPIVPLVFIAATAIIVVNQIVAAPLESASGLLIVMAGLPVYWLWSAHARH